MIKQNEFRAVTRTEKSENAPAPAHRRTRSIVQPRLASNFAETSAGSKKLLRPVPVRKPTKQEFVRVTPDPAFRENVATIE